MNEDFKTKEELIADLDETIKVLECYARRLDVEDDELDEAVKIYGGHILDAVRYAKHAWIELHLVIDYLKGAKRELQVGMPKES